MHKELASKLNIESYRQVDTLNVNGRMKGPNVASWLDGKVTSQLMDKDTAQVTPAELTLKMFSEAQRLGAELKIDQAVDIVVNKDTNKVDGVALKNSGILECDQVVIAMGPW